MKFIEDNIVCIILVTLGLLAWFVTIGAAISTKKTGHYVSGIPGVGGVLIILGFLASPVKWLALIGLLDFHMWYFFVEVVPGIIMVEKMEKNYIPPEEFDGGRVLEYSQHKKEFEEIHFDTEYPYAKELHSINRYIIIQKEGRYILLKNEHNIKVIERIECDTLEECRQHASQKAKWIKVPVTVTKVLRS